MADVAEAFDTILHKGSVGEIYNISSTTEKSNRDVTRDLLLAMGKMASGDDHGAWDTWVRCVSDRPFNDLRYHLDGSKLTSLGWSEKTSWEDGLAATIKWYEKHTRHWDDISGALVAHPRHGVTVSAMRGLANSASAEEEAVDSADAAAASGSGLA